MRKFLLSSVLICMVGFLGYAQKDTIFSQQGNLCVVVDCSQPQIQYSVAMCKGAGGMLDLFIAPSEIGMTLGDGKVLGQNPKVIRRERRSVEQETLSPFYRKSSIKEAYNELKLTFKGSYQLIFRVYDSGVAYRFVTNFKDSIVVKNETATFRFYEGPNPPMAIVPYTRQQSQKPEDFDLQFFNSFENTYTTTRLDEMDKSRIAFLPVMVSQDFRPSWESNWNVTHNRKVVITEADLHDYPGMYLQYTEGNTLKGVFAPCPKEWEQGGYNNLQYVVKSRHDYIAKTSGRRAFPWRVMAISEYDAEFANNDLVYLLAEPSKIADISWIKPGKVAWEWWNSWNIWGVDFEAGINNATYKYYIDFAAKTGIEYVILDEGWAVNKQADLFQVVPEINLQELVDYGKSKGVGIVLWAGYAAIEKDMERVCQHYAEMGVKGFKVDFIDRDDQIAVNFYDRMAETAAKYHLFIDFHGAYKPTGLNRTYPNVLNFEGVFGQENCKWVGSDVDMVQYDVTIPFIRMLAGPLDYTQGAMRNGTKWNYVASWNEPMSQGTRCHQLAEYIIFDAPFSMLCDAPTAYLQEPECTAFIAEVPTVWDETRALAGRVGEYIALAKRKGSTWYVGVLTNWDKRSITLDLSELGITSKTGTAFLDGPNAHRKGCDYQKRPVELPANGRITVDVASGGGAVLIFR